MEPEYIILIIVASVIVLGTFFLLFTKFKNRNNTKQYSERILKIIENLGGNDNIISVTPKMSRVEFVLHNYELVNKDELKNLGVQGISKTSQKITLVVGNELAEDLEKTFKRN